MSRLWANFPRISFLTIRGSVEAQRISRQAWKSGGEKPPISRVVPISPPRTGLFTIWTFWCRENMGSWRLWCIRKTGSTLSMRSHKEAYCCWPQLSQSVADQAKAPRCERGLYLRCNSFVTTDLVNLFETPQLSNVFHGHHLALKVIWTDVAQI